MHKHYNVRFHMQFINTATYFGLHHPQEALHQTGVYKTQMNYQIKILVLNKCWYQNSQ